MDAMNAAKTTVTIIAATGPTHIVEFIAGTTFTSSAKLNSAVRAILAGNMDGRVSSDVDMKIRCGDREITVSMETRADDFKSVIAHYMRSAKFYAEMTPQGPIWTAERIERSRALYAEVVSLLADMAD